MAFPVLPVVFAALVATGLVVDTLNVESAKSDAEKEAKAKANQEKIDELTSKVMEHAEAGRLFPAHRANRDYVNYVKDNYNLSPELEQQLDAVLDDSLKAAQAKYQELKAEYQERSKELEFDDDGHNLFKLQEEMLGKFEGLLGAGAPQLKVIEESFGVNYSFHKYGWATN
ncbi:hypothetical protein [Pseudomonas sp. Root569]|uniref:hypothetical protein n=1 Tax=Pseudomonas sp. Root569 TaxID=1736566 RepID=UPI000702B963|nr:hypothetical protein [Pseudomonas sp. Root569]KRA26350.1 hypothetical protein ASD70_19580 [Pseudomonas sp. Root569]